MTPTTVANLHGWAVRQAVEMVTRGGPFPFNRVCVLVAFAAADAFPTAGVSIRREVRAALEAAAVEGVLSATWRWNYHERRREPHYVSAPVVEVKK